MGVTMGAVQRHVCDYCALYYTVIPVELDCQWRGYVRGRLFCGPYALAVDKLVNVVNTF